MKDSDTTIFEGYPDGYFIITQIEKVTPKNVAQTFREGISNCLLTPIKEYFENSLQESKNKKKKKEYQSKIKKTDKLMEKYKNGVKEEDIQKISDELKVGIKILDIARRKIIHTKPQGRQDKPFEFLNTKINHVELLSYREKLEISPREFVQTKKCLKYGEYYTHNQLFTQDILYIRKDPAQEEVFKWEKDNNIDRIDYFQNPEICEKIKESLHYPVVIDYNPIEDLRDIKQMDMKKCYFSWQKSKYYQKFLFPKAPQYFNNLPSDWPFENYPGFYTIENVSWDKVKGNHKEHLKKLKTFGINGTWPSPSLQFMKDIGITFDIVSGVYSLYSYPIDPTQMLNIKCGPDDIHPYKTWAGKNSRFNKTKQIYIKGDKRLAQKHKHDFPDDDIRYNEYTNEISIELKNNHAYHRIHIASYILSYAYLSIIEEVMTIPVDKVYRIQTDGIYYHKSYTDKFSDKFQNKEIIHPPSANPHDGFLTFYPSVTQSKACPSLREYHKYKYTLAIGPGGSGKTHHFLTDKALVDPLYAAPTNKLVSEKVKEYNLKNACTWSKLLGEDCEPYNGNTGLIIMDEISMLTRERYKKLMELYPRSSIIFCGDPHQLPPIKSKSFIPPGCYKMNFKKNHRCKSIKLERIQEELRKMIVSDQSKDDINAYFLDALKSNLGTVDQYQVNDYIIASKLNRIKEYTDKFKDIRPKKWLITKTGQQKNRGDIIISKTQPKNSELRHAFTAHATQGITIKSPNKLFIDPRDLFDPNMAYTILSRAEYLSQIVLLVTD